MVNPRSLFDRIIIFAILASVGVVVLETEPTMAIYSAWFGVANYVFAALFTYEYGYRIWRAGTWRYIFTPLAIIDLLALIPFYLVFFSDAFLLRLFRLARLLSLAKLGRFSQAHSRILKAIWSVRYELCVSLALAGLAIVLAASAMYIIEGPDQPDKFGSIPRAMWWGVVSLTTVGYGDVYPITLGGMIFTGFYALVAIGFVGVVSGIIVSAVMKGLKQDQADQDGEYPTEADYREFEMAYIRGKQEAEEMMADPGKRFLENPYQQPGDQRAICAYAGYIEGTERVFKGYADRRSVT